jgi:hypothetical protein
MTLLRAFFHRAIAALRDVRDIANEIVGLEGTGAPIKLVPLTSLLIGPFRVTQAFGTSLRK